MLVNVICNSFVLKICLWSFMYKNYAFKDIVATRNTRRLNFAKPNNAPPFYRIQSSVEKK